MSASHGCTDDKAVVESFKEALKQRVGVDTFQAWFVTGITYRVTESVGESKLAAGCLVVEVRKQFALDRLRRNYLREMRGAAMQAWGEAIEIDLQLAAQPQQVELPLEVIDDSEAEPTPVRKLSESSRDESTKRKRRTKSIASLVQAGVAQRGPNNLNDRTRPKNKRGDKSRRSSQQDDSLTQPQLPTIAGSDGSTGSSADAEPSSDTKAQPAVAKMTLETFIDGSCNHLAKTAAQMVCENVSATSLLYMAGPPGVGKTHLMSAIADFLRRRHRMRRVIHLSAERFTNDFITAVSTGGLTSFRGRYRDVDALLIDDVQFLSKKKATVRELQYTVEWLSDRGKTLVFSGSHSPTDISGLTPELAGRMAAGLVCPMQSLDMRTRETLLRRSIDDRCKIAWPEETIQEITTVMAGDGRRIHGIVNLVDLLQRMYGRMPTMDEIRQFGSDQLRSGKPVVTLATIERAVAKTFQLDEQTLKSKSQARTATEPRMLAMYLSRELTPSALAEIGRHYGGRSHSTAILAVRRVESWLATGKSLGRGAAALSAQDAIDRIESYLRSG